MASPFRAHCSVTSFTGLQIFLSIPGELQFLYPWEFKMIRHELRREIKILPFHHHHHPPIDIKKSFPKNKIRRPFHHMFRHSQSSFMSLLAIHAENPAGHTEHLF